jgi:hypothetical protein
MKREGKWTPSGSSPQGDAAFPASPRLPAEFHIPMRDKNHRHDQIGTTSHSVMVRCGPLLVHRGPRTKLVHFPRPVMCAPRRRTRLFKIFADQSVDHADHSGPKEITAARIHHEFPARPKCRS